jgi:polar amino acid transport system ATP-binding protein
MVFQGLNLWPHMTVLENVSYALTKTRAVDQQEAIDRAMQALESIGLAHKVSSYPDSLSGGEAQRVAIIRALVLKPSLLLLDEITSALDVERTWEVLDLVQRLAHEGITIVIVTHELGFARNVATQIAFMDNGCLIEHGATKDIFGSPKSQRTQQFFSHALT